MKRLLLSTSSYMSIGVASPSDEFRIVPNWKTSPLGTVGILSQLEPRVVQINTTGGGGSS